MVLRDDRDRWLAEQQAAGAQDALERPGVESREELVVRVVVGRVTGERGREHHLVLFSDCAGERDTVKRQFLFVNAIGRETGEQNSDQRDKADNEAQPNHSLTQE